MSQKNVPWSFAFGLVAGPIIVALHLSPELLNTLFPGLSMGFKTLILILGVITLLWSMLQSITQAMYIFAWSMLVMVIVFAFELDKLLPGSQTEKIVASLSTSTPLPTLLPLPTSIPFKIDQRKIDPRKRPVDKARDALQFSTFDAKEGTPKPTPTATPNLTPLFDISRFWEKDQSVGTLPKEAFFGGSGKSSGSGDTGGIMSWVLKLWSYASGK